MQKTLNVEISAKTIKIDRKKDQRREIANYYLKTFDLYEQLFKYIKNQSSYYLKPEPLRHPLIFYYGHTAAFFINKLLDAGLIKDRVNEKIQFMFAVGVDEMDWDDLNDTHYDWPCVQDVRIYRQKVKNIVLKVIDTAKPEINWNSDLWIILMGIEHQRIHLQTSAVIMRRLNFDLITPSQVLIDCPNYKVDIKQIPKNKFVQVQKFSQNWNKRRENVEAYGWDNEFGEMKIQLKEFQASEMLVSNGEYLQFIEDNGYNNMKYWTEEGQAWLKSIAITKPLFWISSQSGGGKYKLRTMNQILEMPWDWPVEVNNLEAQAFCKWKSEKLGKNIRLPTEDQYYAIRNELKSDLLDWKYQSVGNINLQFWNSPNPVDMFKSGKFYDVVGNVWQHTITPIYPFNGFNIHPIYEDFTTPTFDNRHNLIKGGSFISTGNQALKEARYAFRRHFYQFAGFRYVISDNSINLATNEEQSDELVEQALKNHYVNKNSYIFKTINTLSNFFERNQVKFNKSLTVGCSVGRIIFQLTKKFKQSFGIDYTARYFQMATRLLQSKQIKYRNTQVKLKDLKINEENVILYQFNPQNPDPKKLNNFDFILVDGYTLREGTINNVLKKTKELKGQGCYIFIIEAEGKNEICDDELKRELNWTRINLQKNDDNPQDEQTKIKLHAFRME